MLNIRNLKKVCLSSLIYVFIWSVIINRSRRSYGG